MIDPDTLSGISLFRDLGRNLRELRDRGLIRLEPRGVIGIVDARRLRDVAEG